jgi:phosphoglycerate dehydrogenase-like enzyme
MQAVLLGRFAVTGRDLLPGMLTTPWTVTALAEDAARADVATALREADAVVAMAWDKERPGAPKLRLLQVCAAGLDRIDVGAVPKGVVICNAYGHEEAIGEYVLMAMLVWTHQFLPIQAAFRSGSWAVTPEGGNPPHGEVLGKTVGIIGTGRIGRAVATRCKAIGARVIGVNRSPIAETALYEERYGLGRREEALARCDIVVVSCGLTDETRGLIGERELAAMKPSALIINVARGPVIAEEPLYRALESKRIAGAVIDTWYDYPTPSNPDPRPSRFPFHELPNVIMTPHTSAWTTGLLERRWGQIASNLDRFARGEPLINTVTQT